jgi:hypothetical protein
MSSSLEAGGVGKRLSKREVNLQKGAKIIKNRWITTDSLDPSVDSSRVCISDRNTNLNV